MQQCGVVGVLQVLVIHLPIRRHRVPVIAQKFELPAVESSIEVAEHLRAEIVLEAPHGGIEGREHHAAARRHLELLEAVLLELDVVAVAALIDSAVASHGALPGFRHSLRLGEK